MGKWLIVVESHCADSAKEKEFHDWYDKVHVPDILKTKEFVKATRYELQQVTKANGDRDRFLAIYEIEADDLDAVLAKHSENMSKAKAEGRLSSLINSTARAIYKQISVVVP
jgi:uncharacterized protein DUF4286